MAVSAAKREGVQVKLYSIIYELIDQIKEAMAGLLDPEHRETVIGHAEVKQVFQVEPRASSPAAWSPMAGSAAPRARGSCAGASRFTMAGSPPCAVSRTM